VLTFCRATNLQAQEYSKLCSESLVRELFELAGHYVERGIFSRAAEPFAKHSQMILHTVLRQTAGTLSRERCWQRAQASYFEAAREANQLLKACSRCDLSARRELGHPDERNTVTRGCASTFPNICFCHKRDCPKCTFPAKVSWN
jgi:hypothetical protein